MRITISPRTKSISFDLFVSCYMIKKSICKSTARNPVLLFNLLFVFHRLLRELFPQHRRASCSNAHRKPGFTVIIPTPFYTITRFHHQLETPCLLVPRACRLWRVPLLSPILPSFSPISTPRDVQLTCSFPRSSRLPRHLTNTLSFTLRRTRSSGCFTVVMMAKRGC